MFQPRRSSWVNVLGGVWVCLTKVVHNPMCLTLNLTGLNKMFECARRPSNNCCMYKIHWHVYSLLQGDVQCAENLQKRRVSKAVCAFLLTHLVWKGLGRWLFNLVQDLISFATTINWKVQYRANCVTIMWWSCEGDSHVTTPESFCSHVTNFRVVW